MSNREIYKWNPVYNYIMKIKDKATQKHIDICNPNISFKNIVKEVGTETEIKMAEILQFNRYKDFILIRYGSYADILSGETEITMDNMWDIYDGFYRECRSLVVDIRNEIIVLSPFKKFRNLNEGQENTIENVNRMISTCKSFEVSNKLDGSMQSASFYNDEIVMAGSQAINKNESWRLQDGYKMLMENEGYISMVKSHPSLTFIFEYISLKDAHVVKYKKEQEGLYLIGVRDKRNGKICSYKEVLHFAKQYKVKTTSVFNKNMEDVMNDIKKYKSNEMEGFVLNIDGFMLKVKCDDYVQIHKTISHMSSTNGIIKAIADDNFDDLISKIPEAYKERIWEVAKIIFEYLYRMNKYVKEQTQMCVSLFQSKKDFMIYVNKKYPKNIKGYIINEYLGRENNFIKSGNEKQPHYRKLNEMKEFLENYI